MMGKLAPALNFNTLMLFFISALVGWGIYKADIVFEKVTRMEERQVDFDRRISNMENAFGIFVPRRNQAQKQPVNP